MCTEVTFEQVYLENRERVYCQLLRMVRRPDLAEDLTQETFLQAWLHFSEFRGEGKLSTWLYTIALNTVRMYMRLRSTNRQFISIDEQLEDGDTAGDFVLPSVASSALLRVAINEAFQGLSELQREAFVLHMVEGRECEEIAESLGLTLEAVKSRNHQAVKKMRRGLL